MIEINNLTKFRLDKKLYTGVAKKVIKGENKEIEFKNLSIAFVAPLEIQKANKKYRKKNKPTDVLSFGQANYSLPTTNYKLLVANYQLIICPEVVRQNATKFGNTFKKEMIKILIHGIMHLCGYDHENSEAEAQKMEKREEFYMSKI